MTSAFALEKVIGDPGFAIRFNDLLSQIAPLKNSVDVTRILHEIKALMRCNGAVFTSFVREDDNLENYQHLVACPQYWCNQYITNRWYLIDPALVYAHLHSEPVVADEMPLRSNGQRTFRQKAYEAGFRSIAIVPAHSASGRSRMGVLYMTSDDPVYFTKANLPKAKMFLRAIAAELLDWWFRKVRADLLNEIAFKPSDLELLKLVHQGHASREISSIVGISVSAVDQRIARLAIRLNASNRAMAAKVAFEYGLLEAA